jgi:hypothetical protein
MFTGIRAGCEKLFELIHYANLLGVLNCPQLCRRVRDLANLRTWHVSSFLVTRVTRDGFLVDGGAVSSLARLWSRTKDCVSGVQDCRICRVRESAATS